MSGCEAFRFPDAGKGPFSAAKDTLLRAKARNTLNARMLCASWFNVSANQPGQLWHGPSQQCPAGRVATSRNYSYRRAGFSFAAAATIAATRPAIVYSAASAEGW